MAVTPSNMIALGTKAYDFSLWNPKEQKNNSLHEIKGDKGTLIIFMCNHCPFVVHIIEKLVAIYEEYNDKGVQFIAINANDVENYPEDSPENMLQFAKKWNLKFPYLFDESQDIAKAYQAACTPDFYLFDKELELVYRGRMDGSTPGNNIPNTGEDLIRAIENLLANKAPLDDQKHSLGCNIKWKE